MWDKKNKVVKRKKKNGKKKKKRVIKRKKRKNNEKSGSIGTLYYRQIMLFVERSFCWTGGRNLQINKKFCRIETGFVITINLFDDFNIYLMKIILGN